MLTIQPDFMIIAKSCNWQVRSLRLPAGYARYRSCRRIHSSTLR